MYFSISPQSVALPGGPTLDFRVNPDDTSKVEIHLAGDDDRGNPGTHILTFNRNGGPVLDQFVPSNPSAGNRDPLAGFKSVDDDAVRLSPEPTPPTPPKPTPSVPPAPPAPKPSDTPLPPKTVTSTSLDVPAPP